MTRRIAISGHRGLPPAVARSVDAAFRAALTRLDEPVVGLSCLAEGADTIGARAVLDADGLLEAVIPARKYRQALPPEHWPDYDDLYRLANRVHELDSDDATPRSYQTASEFMLDHADTLWAVWDGLPARGYGGTADVVAAARARGMPITVFWPGGAVR
ncbi:hypothetical protein ITP53_35380 [Nonomuraea sp. K274]|uniref:Uncharacterized protein n=1 Tax=Nonomuraea cypriaca TaxID=1187855 RepID=A0A931F4G7_9ACTN|nr:hypothetical protein [Nonomuraea cypriaca]MBF8190898.1 hypothetical protein [Nonomuraea cypriaca]